MTVTAKTPSKTVYRGWIHGTMAPELKVQLEQLGAQLGDIDPVTEGHNHCMLTSEALDVLQKHWNPPKLLWEMRPYPSG